MPFKQFYFFSFILLFVYSCKNPLDITDSPDAKLEFSTDTLLFDTVFTSLGSTTGRIVIRNKNKSAISISNIRLGGGNASAYRINVDGVPGDNQSNVEIAGNDSVFLFVEVTINPTAALLPFIVTDSILFTTNGNKQQIQLATYGQNARFYNDSILPCNTTWDATLPYVIYSGVLVDSLCKLTIEKGTKIYFHSRALLLVKGTLLVNGELNDTVVFKGDRLEEDYIDEPGQWNSIQFLPGSTGNKINYAIIKNAVFGVVVGTFPLYGITPDLEITNSIIKNMSATGLYGINSIIKSYNNLIFRCGQAAFYGQLGGDYDIAHTTIGNFNGSFFNRKSPSAIFVDFLEVEKFVFVYAKLKIRLRNNIIWGALEDELAILKAGSLAVDSNLNNNLIRDSELKFKGNGNILNKDPLFEKSNKENFTLMENSPARGMAININAEKQIFINDLAGKPRSSTPTIGCYE